MSHFWKKKKSSMKEQNKEQKFKDKEAQTEEQQEQNKEETPKEATSSPTETEQETSTPAAEAEQVDQPNEPSSEPKEQESPDSLDDAMKALAEMQLRLRTAEEEAQQAKEQAMRLQADFVNFRKRQEKEAAQTIRFANEDLLGKLLPILDNFDRTLDSIDKTDNLSAIKEGIGMVGKSMRRQLDKVGLEPIEAKGKLFDSEVHEAITTVPVEDEKQKGMVIDEVEKGYKLKDRVIRYAKVVVGE